MKPRRPAQNSSRRPEKRYTGSASSRQSGMPAVDEARQFVLVGRRPVLEALRAGRAIARIWVQESSKEGSLREILSLARQNRIVMAEVPKSFLDRIAEGATHQGVAAQVAVKPTLALEDLPALLKTPSPPLLYILDGIQDPHNLGAILRTADATGAQAVVMAERGSVGLTAAVAKASAGAIEYVPVVRVTNLAQAIEKIQALGIFVYAADPRGGTRYDEVDWTGPAAVVIGGEGRGVRRLIQSRSDVVIALPMMGHVSSINASNAACVIGFEAIRQRIRKNSVLTRV